MYIEPTTCYCFRRLQPGKNNNKQCDQQTQISDAVSAGASDSRNFRLKTLRLQLNMNPSTLNLRYIHACYIYTVKTISLQTVWGCSYNCYRSVVHKNAPSRWLHIFLTYVQYWSILYIIHAYALHYCTRVVCKGKKSDWCFFPWYFQFYFFPTIDVAGDPIIYRYLLSEDT